MSFKDFMSKDFKVDDGSLLVPSVEEMLHQYRNGKSVGEPSRVESLDDIFSWKRGFINCWTGLPNSGKTTLLLFLMLLKSVHDGWKWCVWTPEMLDSVKTGGRVRLSASDVYDELVYMLSGKNVYKHYNDKYHMPQIPEERYVESLKWVSDHFFVIQPSDNKYSSIMDNYLSFHERIGFDGLLMDPWKNIVMDSDKRFDLMLHETFADLKLISLDTNTTVNIIAHSRSDKSFRNEDGTYRMVTQYDLAGGAAWNNSMDGIYSYYRPEKDPLSPVGEFHNLKQRKQALVGKPGKFTDIHFDFRTNRFYFGGVCPIDGTVIPSRDAAARLPYKDDHEPGF